MLDTGLALTSGISNRWNALRDEPRNHALFLILVVVAAVGAVPFWFVGRDTVFVLGLPVWLWSSLAFAVGLSGVTVWGILRLWKDDELD
jgi:hypothetical protein